VRFESIRMRGLGPFRSEVTIDLTNVPGELVAITGPNGAGKSTTLELLAGALFRECPTRGALKDLATSRDAYVEVRAVNGHAYTIRQTVDAISGNGESLVLEDGNPKPLVESAKRKAFDAWAAEHLVSPDVLYSSSFAVQGRRGFLDLSRADRVRVLNRALGIEQLERLAARAAERQKAAQSTVDGLRARLLDLSQPNLLDLQQRAAEAQRLVDSRAEATRMARLALQRGRDAAADASRAMELAEQRKAAQKRLDAGRSQLADLDGKIERNRGLLNRATEIRDAEAKGVALEARIVDASGAAGAAQTERSQAELAERVAQGATQRTYAALEGARRRVQAAKGRLVDSDAVEAAVAEVNGLSLQVAGSESAIAKVTALVLEGKDRRITGLRSGHDDIVMGESDPVGVSTGTLHADSKLAKELETAPATLANLQANLADQRRKLADTQRLASRLGEVQAARAALTEAEADLVRAEAEAAEATLEKERCVQRLASAIDRASSAEEVVRSLLRERDALGDTRALLVHLERAEARIEELTGQLPAVREALALAEAELSGLPYVTAERVDLQKLETAVHVHEQEEQTARELAARRQAEIERAVETIDRRTKLSTETKAAETELADWTRLAQDLGRDGLQALEIDAAVPEINEIANDLLHECHGSRFTVELRTDRLSSDGKRQIEDIEVRVIDTQEGRDAEASTYSGGELVIVGEALSLALTTVACRRAGIERPTLVRDETGSALSADNGRAYIAMLRRAARHIGADKVLYVSHTPELQDLADARIEISADHQVTVRAA